MAIKPKVTRHVGAIKITAVADGTMSGPYALMPAFDAARGRQIKAELGKPFPEIPSLDINAFFIEAGDQKILVDTGSRAGESGDAGRFGANFTDLGYAPEEVDIVFLTHLHRDHLGGLLAPDGSRAFPNATLAMARAEHEHVNNAATYDAMPERGQASLDLARATLAPYAGQIRLLDAGEALVQGIQMLALPGHTPGHSGLMLESGGARLLIWGDIVHLADFQAAEPDWSVVFDYRPEDAIASRRAIMARAADEGLDIAGMHIDFPGFARVERAGDGFRITPAG